MSPTTDETSDPRTEISLRYHGRHLCDNPSLLANDAWVSPTRSRSFQFSLTNALPCDTGWGVRFLSPVWGHPDTIPVSGLWAGFTFST